MGYFAVTRDAGPGWIEGRGAFEQPAVSDHAAFMNQLADDGYVLFAGPLAGSEAGRIRVLLIADAQSETEVYDRLAGDPWGQAQILVTSRVETWTPIVGAQRLAPIT
jgi:uncharacterized protein YciI